MLYNISRCMGKPTICICENKDADQLCSNCTADQRLCFRDTDSTIPLLLKYKISSLLPSSVTVQADLCQTCSETTLLVFSRTGSYVIGHLLQQLNSNRKANKEINYFIIERISDAEDSHVERKSCFMYA